MAERVYMTALSPTMEEGTIAQWTKSEGDTVAAGDVLCEVETDKATMDYEATQEGTLLKIIVGAGSSAKVGDTIAVLGEAGEDVGSIVAEAASSPGASEPGKAAPPAAPAPQSAPASTTGDTGTAVPSAPPAVAATPPGSAGTPTVAGAADRRVKASPLARKLAESRGIDISLVSGSGPAGRIVKEDVDNYRPPVGGLGSAAASPAGLSTPVAPAGQDVSIPVDGKRAVIARRLSESKFGAPHYYLKKSVRMDAIIEAREALNKRASEKVGMNAFLLKFAAEALKHHRGVNASWQGDHILQFGSIDIGLAVDVGNGLITPIVRNCGGKGIVEIDRELKTLIEKAKAGKLQPDEYTGATFTISNLGSFGIEEFTAIINPPGSAILAVGSVERVATFTDDGAIVPVRVIKLTLSCDHRVIDGAAGARFLGDLVGTMEEPVRALF